MKKKKTDYKTSAEIIAKKPLSEIDKNDRAMIQARMKEIKKYRSDASTTQNAIGYIQMYKDGVCQFAENKYSKTIQFFDTNYQLAEFDEQNNIFSKYCDLINYFDNTVTFQLTFENQNRSQDKLVKNIQIPEQEDEFNNIRSKYSEMLTNKLLSGKNGQSSRKFLTFTIESSGYIKMYITDLEKLLDDLNSKNERLFHINISIRNYARNKKDLKLQLELLKRICQKNNCTLMSCDYLQEDYLTSTLPLGVNNILVSREMHTSGVAIFVPFTTQELFQLDGTYYGLNTVSGNMIMANRSNLKNPNGLILGTPGSDKSFSVKREILDSFLKTTDDIIICNPEGEYFPLVEALHGQLVK